MAEVIYVDSRHRASGTPSDFAITLRETVRGTDLSTVRVDSVRLVNSLWTITAQNRFVYVRWEDDEYPHAHWLEVGYHDAVGLCAHLDRQLQKPGCKITAEYIAWSNSMRLTSDKPFEIWTDEQLAAIPGPVWQALGYPQGTSPTSPHSFNDVLRNPGGSLKGERFHIVGFVSVCPATELYLCCREMISRNCHGPSHRHHVLARLDVDSGIGTMISGKGPSDVAVLTGDHAFRTLHFQLIDGNGRVVELHDDSLVFTLVLE